MGKILRRTTVYLIAASMLIVLGGCSNADVQTGLSTEDEELVAEYAAGVLMKYSSDQNGGLGTYVPEKPAPAVSENTAMQPAPVEEVPDEPAEVPEQGDDVNVDDAPNEVTEDVADVSEAADAGTNGAAICEAIGISGFDMAYKGYETADVYPDPGEAELSFSMQAAEGKKLLVVHFDITNPDGSDKECSVLDNAIKFRILINEKDRVNEQMTILLNDLKSFSDTIPAGQTVDTVLVFEVDNDVAGSISSLALIVVNSQGESQFLLK